MGIWIRSQDRRCLIHARYLAVVYDNEIIAVADEYDPTVGKYTPERAIEVLNEIQKAIENGQKIFEMPDA